VLQPYLQELLTKLPTHQLALHYLNLLQELPMLQQELLTVAITPTQQQLEPQQPIIEQQPTQE